MTKRVLVTGASGYLGRSCLPKLIAAGYESENISTILEKIKASHCLHLAWYTKHGKFWSSSENLKWVNASISFLKLFYKNGGKRAVIAGSCAEYDWHHGICDENKTPLNPATTYGQSKHALHQYIASLSRKEQINYAWARLFFLYGEDEGVSRLVPSVCISLLRGEKARTSSGEQQRDFMHISDASAGLVAMINHDYVGPVNVASGEAISIRDIVKRIATIIGRNELLELGAIQSQEGEPLLLAADVNILNSIIQFKQSIGIEEGLLQTVDYWKSKLNTK